MTTEASPPHDPKLVELLQSSLACPSQETLAALCQHLHTLGFNRSREEIMAREIAAVAFPGKKPEDWVWRFVPEGIYPQALLTSIKALSADGVAVLMEYNLMIDVSISDFNCLTSPIFRFIICDNLVFSHKSFPKAQTPSTRDPLSRRSTSALLLSRWEVYVRGKNLDETLGHGTSERYINALRSVMA